MDFAALTLGKSPETEGKMNKQMAREDHDGNAKSGIDPVEEALEESFPASDPPSFTPVVSVGPKEEEASHRHWFDSSKWWRSGSTES